MGSLALAGALAGFGKGMVANAEYQQKVDFAALEEARAMRVAQWEQGQLDAREARREATEAAKMERQAELSMEETKMRAGFDTSKELLRGVQESERSAAEQKAAMERTKYTADAGLEEARIRANAAGKEGGKKGGPKFKPQDIPIYMVKDGIVLDKQSVPGVFEETSGTRYAQVGDKFFYVGKNSEPDESLLNRNLEREKNKEMVATPSGKKVPFKAMPGPRAIQNLMDHPEDAADFIRVYGFLPVGWYRRAVAASSEDEE